MFDYNTVDNEILLAKWLLQHYFVAGSYYYTCGIGTGSKEYRHVKQSIGIDQIIRHLHGEVSLAAPSAYNRMAVSVSMDIDSLDNNMVARAREALHRQNLPVVTSFSGKKGYHLTVFLNMATPLADAQSISRTIQNVLNQAGIKYDKISPSPTGNGGDGLTIPLGLHPETLNRCYFVDDNFETITDPLSLINSIATLHLEMVRTPLQTVDKETGEIKTVYPKAISTRPCVNKLWNEGLQAPGTRHFATMVVANSVQRSSEIAVNDKGDAVADWVNRIFNISKNKGLINVGTSLREAELDGLNMLRHYSRYGTFGELCENELFKKGMRSACVDEYQCKLKQNHGSVNYRLMRTLGVFAAPNANPKGLGKSAMAIYEAIEDIVQDYPVFDWNGQQAFSLSIQELIGLSSCSRATVINQRRNLLEVGLLVSLPKEEIPLDILKKYPSYVEFYYLPEINGELIKSVLKKLRG